MKFWDPNFTGNTTGNVYTNSYNIIHDKDMQLSNMIAFGEC